MAQELSRVLDLIESAAEAYGRPDLGALLATARAGTEEAPLVLVGGQFNQGKSSIVNLVAAEPVCPASAEHTTVVPTLVHLDGPRRAHAHPADGSAPVPVEIDALVDVVTETSVGERPALVAVHTGSVAADQLVLVDLPGTGGWAAAGISATLPWVPSSTGVLVAHDGASALSASELDFVRTTRQFCPRVAIVVTRIDLHPSWRIVVDDVREQLHGAGLHDIDLLPVSARLAEWDDPEAVDRSGLVPLLDWLLTTCGLHDHAARVVTVAESVLGQLEAGLQEQLRARSSEPAAAPETARPPLPWTTVLADGISDVQHTLDARWHDELRELQRFADTLLDQGDPAESWSTVERELRAESTRRATALVATLQAEVRALAVDVAEALGATMPGLRGDWGTLGTERLAEVDLALRASAAQGLASRGIAALRASYTGVSLSGMVAGLAGLSIAGPALVVAGLAMMGKSLADERRRMLEQRRQAARASARRFLDETSLVVQQALRDGLRAAQRELRNLALTLENEIALATPVERSPRDGARAADIEAELARLGSLRSRLARATEHRSPS